MADHQKKLNLTLSACRRTSQSERCCCKSTVSKDLDEAVINQGVIEFGEEIVRAISLYNEKNIQIFDIFLDKILYQQLGRAKRVSKDIDLVRLVGIDLIFTIYFQF